MNQIIENSSPLPFSGLFFSFLEPAPSPAQPSRSVGPRQFKLEAEGEATACTVSRPQENRGETDQNQVFL